MIDIFNIAYARFIKIYLILSQNQIKKPYCNKYFLEKKENDFHMHKFLFAKLRLRSDLKFL